MRVIVIGSGIAGAATAYHLVRRGAEAVVVDAGLAGAATGAGAGIVSPWTSHWEDALFPLASAAAAYYPELAGQLAEETGEESSYEVVGGMIVSADDSELGDRQRRLIERAAIAPGAGEIRRFDPAQARELFPPLAPELGAVHLSGAARVDGRQVRRALLTASRRRGARLVESHARLSPRPGRAPRVLAGGEVFDADAVVVAAGAWTAELVAQLGIRVPVTPQRGQISHFDLPGEKTSAWPVVLPRTSHYLLAFPGSRVVAGATRESGAGFDHRVTAAGQREVLEHALAVAPGLADATLAETRVGFRPGTPDGVPLLGRAADGLVLATGFGPAGLTLAPFAGKLVAALALGEDAGFDLTVCAPGEGGGGGGGGWGGAGGGGGVGGRS
ncbi:NAD(P)/FAD-dependent oxidoreductase, partial [Amycolatopsis sp. NPDC059021]|uniref:NAD(P)/FAD-dependent oxidoreductase n=1 Tax=Amycolatopsis sp. NPDC059021 TaxID=3346704 RepID=UPI00366E557A